MYLKKLTAAVLSALLTVAVLPVMPGGAAELVDSGMDYTESTETINNPGAGYTSTLWYTCKPGETQVKSPTGNLVLMFIDIGAFSSGINGTTDDAGNYTEGVDYDLDETFFKAMRGTFENCRRNGCTVAVRFRYDGNGKTNPEPATFDQLLHHIDQIKQDGFLEDYKDILMYVESGFVGAWGEQHSGKYTSLEYKAQLLEAVLDMTPDDIPVTVRTPNIFRQWMGLDMDGMAAWESEPGSQAARVGLYNDGYMGSDSDLGTYSNRAVETGWLGRQTVSTYYGGEFSGNLEWTKKFDTYLPENAIPEMYATHLSYINSNIYSLYNDYTFGEQYDVANVDNSAYYGQTVYKFMRDHLGYRFTVRDCDLSAQTTQGGEMEMAFRVENTGFANPIRAQKAELLLEKDGCYVTAQVDMDSREWASCTISEEHLTAKLPGFLEPGNWNVYLRLSVGNQDVPDANLRTVQFTNKDIWNSSLGANKMGTIHVTETDNIAQKTDHSFTVNGAGEGNACLYTVNDVVILDGNRSSDSEWTTESLVAEDGDNHLYLSCDDQYFYVGAEIVQNASSPVYNIRIENEDTGKSYWYYQQRNGAIYYSQGSHDGILLKKGTNFCEWRIPFGDVMDLHPGSNLKTVRVFVQDEADSWTNVGDIRTEAYTVGENLNVYSGAETVSLQAEKPFNMQAVTSAEGASFTWLHDGTPLAETSSTLTLTPQSAADEGQYSVQIVTPDGIHTERDICLVEKVYTDNIESLPGDLNLDGKVDTLDVKLLQNWLHGKNVHIPGNADLNTDGVWDVFDLGLLKRLEK